MEKRRAAPGDGTVFQAKDGRFVFMYSLGKTADGKRLRRKVTGWTEAELQRKIFDLKTRGGGTIAPRATGTVGDFVGEWLEGSIRPNRAPATYASYEAVWRVHVESRLGHVLLEKLEVGHVLAMMRSMRTAGATASMINRACRVMHRAIAVAIRQGNYHRQNPFAMVERPIEEPHEATALSVEQAMAFLAASRESEDRFDALFSILVTVGLRVGEALALRWSDVDIKQRTLQIVRKLTEVGGKQVFSAPRTGTKKARRWIAYGQIVAGALERRRVAHATEGHGSDLVFCTRQGGAVWLKALRNWHFYPILAKAGIPRIRLHDLRHSMTSIGIASGVNFKVMADRLGHSTARLTIDRYSHLLPGQQKAAADAIDAALAPRQRRFRIVSIKRLEGSQ